MTVYVEAHPHRIGEPETISLIGQSAWAPPFQTGQTAYPDVNIDFFFSVAAPNAVLVSSSVALVSCNLALRPRIS